MIGPLKRALVVAGLLLAATPLAAQISTPQLLRVQGHLSDRQSGSPVPADGSFSMTFRLFDADLGGQLVAGSGPLIVTVDQGIYEVDLPFSASAFSGTERWLEIEVEGELLAPRLRVVSTPFAYMAEKVGGFSASELDESDEITAHAAVPDAHREHASLEESAEIGTALAAHGAAADPHPGYLKRSGDTIDGTLAVNSPAADALLLTAPNDVRLSFSSGGGPAHTFGWDESRSAFAVSDGLALDNGDLLRWPMTTGPSAGVATFSFSKLATTPPNQLEHPDGELDETFQFCYNCRDDGSTFQADPNQHAWNQKVEATYWNAWQNHEQLEVNWNFTDPGGLKWRPFAFWLQISPTCEGGGQAGEACVSAQQVADCIAGGGICGGENTAEFGWDASPYGYCSLDPSTACTEPSVCPGGSCSKSLDLEIEQGTGRLLSRQGIGVEDLRGAGPGGSAFVVASQSGNDPSSGNIDLQGGGATTGHLRMGSGHLWYDDAANLFRSADGAAAPPSTDSDGAPLHAPGGMSDDWGEALWGNRNGAVDTGQLVCGQAGLNCVGAVDLASGQDRNCGFKNWSGPFFVALCR